MGRWLIANSRYDCLVHSRLTKIISLIISFCLILEQSVFAQTIDLSHYFARGSAPQSDKFRPLHLRYISYDNQANDFKLLIDKGDFFNQKTEKTLELEKNTQELMKYFFIGLTLPNEKFWVNLRPDSPDNILDPDLEKTDIGRIFLEADLQLKKDTSGMTSPQNPQGKEYWDKLYKKAGELFGTKNISIPTITRPWIVPNEIIIRESPEGAYIYKATLKVMLEEDYLNQKTEKPENGKTEVYNFSDPRLKELNEYSTQLIKESIIPKLTYELNASKRYAPLRQVYYSLILAQWFKQKYGSVRSIRAPDTRAPVNNYIDMIDSGNLANLTSNQPYDKQSYFQQYQKSFQDGEYNLQEPVYTSVGQSIRMYVSGGIKEFMASSSLTVNSVDMGLAEKNYLMPIVYPIAYNEAGIVSSAVMDGDDKNSAASSAVENDSFVTKRELYFSEPFTTSGGVWVQTSNYSGKVVDNYRVYINPGKGSLLKVAAIASQQLSRSYAPDAAYKRLFDPDKFNHDDTRMVFYLKTIEDAVKLVKILRPLFTGDDLKGTMPLSGTIAIDNTIMITGATRERIAETSAGLWRTMQIAQHFLSEGFLLYDVITNSPENMQILDMKKLEQLCLRHTYRDFTVTGIGRWVEITVNGKNINTFGQLSENIELNKPIKFFNIKERKKEQTANVTAIKATAANEIQVSTSGNLSYKIIVLSNEEGQRRIGMSSPISGSVGTDEVDGLVSFLSASNDKGGVDFAALPIQTQAMPVVSSAITSNFKPLSSSELDAEWAQIEAMVNAAIRPAPERLERYAASVSSSLDYPRVRDKFVGLFADILRNDETSQRQLRLEPALKNILLALESE